MRDSSSASFRVQATAALGASLLRRLSGAGSSGLRETKLIGNEFRLDQTWPTTQSLQGRRDVNNMRLRSIEFSRWSSSDYDFSGLQVTNNQG